MTSTQTSTLQSHACAIGDIAGELLRYIDATNMVEAHPAQIVVLRQLIKETNRRAGLLIDLGNELAGI